MFTTQDLLRGLLAPLLVAATLASIGRWRGWPWMFPAAAGVGFIAAFGLLGVPRLPPRDGTDWLFWLALPLTCIGVLDALFSPRRGWIMGAAAGGVAFVVLHPIVPQAVSAAELWTASAALAATGMLLILAMEAAQIRLGSGAIVAGLFIITAGAGIIILSFHLRIVGVYGLAASAALFPLAILAMSQPVGRSVATISVPLLAGLLIGGHYYPEPGVPWPQFVALLAAPALLLVGAFFPAGRGLRIVAGLAILAFFIALIAIPPALAAKRAAEGNEPPPDRQNRAAQWPP